ncbi:hypothetical protein MRX96_010905 [Rhipicephalus microplus]
MMPEGSEDCEVCTSATPTTIVGAPTSGLAHKPKRKRQHQSRDSPSSQPEAPTVRRLHNTTVIVPDVDHETVVSKAVWRGATALEAAAIATNPAVAETVLYRSSTSGGSLTRLPRFYTCGGVC